MVGIAQLAELRIVIPAVVGSSPIVHPKQPKLNICLNVWFYLQRFADIAGLL